MAKRTHKTEEHEHQPAAEPAEAPPEVSPPEPPTPRVPTYTLEAIQTPDVLTLCGQIATDLKEFLRGGKALGFRTVATLDGEQLRVCRIDGQQFIRILGGDDVVA